MTAVKFYFYIIISIVIAGAYFKEGTEETCPQYLNKGVLNAFCPPKLYAKIVTVFDFVYDRVAIRQDFSVYVRDFSLRQEILCCIVGIMHLNDSDDYFFRKKP